MYYDVLPNANVRAKYIKGKKQDKYNKDLVKFIANHYQIAKIEAEEYIGLLKKDDLSNILKQYGKTEKEIKKLLK